jgi:hypothetical protein
MTRRPDRTDIVLGALLGLVLAACIIGWPA